MFTDKQTKYTEANNSYTDKLEKNYADLREYAATLEYALGEFFLRLSAEDREPYLAQARIDYQLHFYRSTVPTVKSAVGYWAEDVVKFRKAHEERRAEKAKRKQEKAFEDKLNKITTSGCTDG